MNALEQPVHLVDGFPMPVCKITRAYGSHCFKGKAAYGYCAAKDEKFYGFEGQVLMSAEGVICGYTFAAANSDERDMLLDITHGLKGLLIGDKGYIRPSLKEELAKQGLLFYQCQCLDAFHVHLFRFNSTRCILPFFLWMCI